MTLVISDTHLGKYDKDKKYINTGCIIENLESYLVIDDTGNPNLVKQIKRSR